ncbi:LOW QUALITY PROTEIN: hypothetical protein KUTeg_024139 [Tegillarca granosa]|uniref:Uncharacterized protein n=1 Tax=Tegillarca granosa TaxID=220873 RepID=A0ABQ9DWH3_TEGGR|nr:LOW QUALITY PROTEIN: hypothetical protein KUTeg_024139 [Tegillarca granosa]
MMVKVLLCAHRQNDSTTDTKKHRGKERERVHQQYFSVENKNTFLFAHGIRKSQLESIAKSLDTEGLTSRTHGNKGKSPKHAMSVADLQHFKHFMTQYAVTYGMPLPGRLANHRDTKVALLPSDKTKADIHQDYLKAATDTGYKKMPLSLFKQLWQEYTPSIVLMKPATDLCCNCQEFSQNLSNAGNMAEEGKN